VKERWGGEKKRKDDDKTGKREGIGKEHGRKKTA
jgi:hypothetical protein